MQSTAPLQLHMKTVKYFHLGITFDCCWMREIFLLSLPKIDCFVLFCCPFMWIVQIIAYWFWQLWRKMNVPTIKGQHLKGLYIDEPYITITWMRHSNTVKKCWEGKVGYLSFKDFTLPLFLPFHLGTSSVLA